MKMTPDMMPNPNKKNSAVSFDPPAVNVNDIKQKTLMTKGINRSVSSVKNPRNP